MDADRNLYGAPEAGVRRRDVAVADPRYGARWRSRSRFPGAGITSHFEQCLGTGLKQEMVEDLFVVQGEWHQLMG